LPEYVDCVNDTLTFVEIEDVSGIRTSLHPKPRNSKCKQAEAQFMALLLNVCSGRVAECNAVVDPVLGDSTVGDVIVLIDGLLSNGDRSRQDCVFAQAVADRINNGQTLLYQDSMLSSDDNDPDQE
jgi:hypothetical protein